MISQETRVLLSLFLVMSLFGLTDDSCAERLRIIAWNVESGGASGQATAMVIGSTTGCDIWALSEVKSKKWAHLFREAAAYAEGASFEQILGTTGGGDRLLILYNSDRLEKEKHFELKEMMVGQQIRAPLVAQFQVKPNGRRFLFMVNHLCSCRKKPSVRRQQARLLNEWAQGQTLPIIAAGDFNFQWDLQRGHFSHDTGYDNLTAEGVFQWIRPEPLLATHCNRQYNTVLDYIFVSGPAKDWEAEAKTLLTYPSYCPDDKVKSNHRPVSADIEVPDAD